MNTNGSVTIEDGNPGEPGDFNPRRKVSVTISYQASEGEDGTKFLDEAADAANKKVDELLGRKVAEKPTRKPRTPLPAKDQAHIDASAPGSDKAALEAAAGLTTEAAAKAAGVKTTDKPAEVVAKLVAVEDDNIDDLLGDAAPVPITDAELAKAAQNKNAQMKVKDPNFSVKIRALVVEYAGNPPKKITDVPVAKRQEFLDKLRDLT